MANNYPFPPIHNNQTIPFHSQATRKSFTLYTPYKRQKKVEGLQDFNRKRGTHHSKISSTQLAFQPQLLHSHTEPTNQVYRPHSCRPPYCNCISAFHTGDTSWIEPPLLCGPLEFDRRGNRSPPPLVPGTVRSLPCSNLSRLSEEEGVEDATPAFTLGVWLRGAPTNTGSLHMGQVRCRWVSHGTMQPEWKAWWQGRDRSWEAARNGWEIQVKTGRCGSHNTLSTLPSRSFFLLQPEFLELNGAQTTTRFKVKSVSGNRVLCSPQRAALVRRNDTKTLVHWFTAS